MRTKRTLAAMLALSVGMSMTACGGKQAEATKATEKEQLAGDLNNDGQIEMGQDGVEVEVNVSDVHMNASEAFAAGKWEALFTPVDIPGRFVDMEDFDLTPTEEEKAAMEKEPAYGKPVLYYMSDGCTSGPTVADDKGNIYTVGDRYQHGSNMSYCHGSLLCSQCFYIRSSFKTFCSQPSFFIISFIICYGRS